MALATGDGIAIVVAISSILSLLGSGVIVASYALWPRLRSTSRLLLVCISFADYASAAGYGASALASIQLGRSFEKENGLSCVFQSVVTTWSSIAAFCFTVALATYLYISIVWDNVALAKKLVPVYAAVSIGIPTAVTIAAVPSNALGYSGIFTTSGWCWINDEPTWPNFGSGSTTDSGLRYADARLFWMLLAGKFWEITSCIVIFILYFRIRRHVWRQTRVIGKQFLTTESKAAAINADRKMLVIPLAFLLLRIWGTIRFIIDVSVGPKPGAQAETRYIGLAYMQAVGDTGQGFVNFFIFCWNSKAFQGLLFPACSCCRFRRTHRGEASPLLGRDPPAGLQVSYTDACKLSPDSPSILTPSGSPRDNLHGAPDEAVKVSSDM